ncbi:retrotransposon protein, putative, ty1-copia subclass [Tanacetum coccineum]|uniref:Retrotransposon protein, putative, ty1-copia subclass n=1 Tax=Tanacetum coccineum TaxID=301880 RepID=A0ABQ5A0W2_9ASTR
MFEREKLSRTNFNDWFRSLKLVLRVEKKLFVIEQPISPASPVDFTAQVLAQWNAVYDAHNEVACLMLGKEGKSVSSYVVKMKGHVEQLTRLGYVLPQDLNVGLIMASQYEKDLPKKAATPQVMAIQGGRIHKANKNRLMLKAKHPTKDDAYHHYKEVGHCKRNCHAYLVELIKKKKQVGIAISSAHISKKRIEKLPHDGLLKSTDEESFDQCVSCLPDKMTRKPFPHRTERATDLLGLIHTDYSRYGYVYLLKHKHEVFETFKVFKNEVENQLRKTIKALRSDRGGEYISQEFKDYLKACGIIQQLTPPYTPQHNGDYALETTTCILNMVPTKRVDKTPYELWYGKVPNLSYLKVWGCEALVKRDMANKLQQRYVKCIFIGYSKETLGYYFYFPPKNKIVVASEIPMEVEGFEPPQEEVVPVHRSARTHRAPDRLCLNIEVEEHSLGDLNKPNNYKSALLYPKSDKWVNAMNAEMHSVKDNQVWCLVDLLPNCKTVRRKWFLRKRLTWIA